jgi:hypothetical protein
MTAQTPINRHARKALLPSSRVAGMSRHTLVVGNPPHFDCAQIAEISIGDGGWRIHRQFFESDGGFLRAGRF